MADNPIIELDGFNAIVRGRDALYIANKNDAFVGQALCRYGEYAQAEYDLLQAIVQPGHCVLEVGANMGAHTVRLAKRIGLSGRIVAVEPQPPLFQAMAGTMALNHLMNVDCYPCLAGAEKAVKLLPSLDYRQPNNFGGINLEQEPAQGTQVPMTTVDDLYTLPRLNLLKIDVEGMELAVLQGAAATIDRFRPFVYFENDRQDRSAALLSWLFERDYRMWWHTPALFNPNNFFGNQENVFGAAQSLNVLAVPAEIDTQIGLRPITSADDFPNIAG